MPISKYTVNIFKNRILTCNQGVGCQIVYFSSFLAQVYGVIIIYNTIHSFKDTMFWQMCTHIYKHLQNEESEYFHHLGRFLSCHLSSAPTGPLSDTLPTDLTFVSVYLPFLECNKVESHNMWYPEYPFTSHDVFEIHPWFWSNWSSFLIISGYFPII